MQKDVFAEKRLRHKGKVIGQISGESRLHRTGGKSVALTKRSGAMGVISAGQREAAQELSDIEREKGEGPMPGHPRQRGRAKEKVRDQGNEIRQRWYMLGVAGSKSPSRRLTNLQESEQRGGGEAPVGIHGIGERKRQGCAEQCSMP